MFLDLSRRHREDEWMDRPSATAEELAPSLRYIRKINSLLGYTRVTVGYFKRFSADWKPGETIRILDLATGSADVPHAILRWADQAGFDVRVVGLDLHPATAAIASREKHHHLTIIRGDAMLAPFDDGIFDYVMTNMFLHHLDEDHVVRLLSEMGRVARRGIVAADLIRSERAYAWIWLFTTFASPMVRHDARASVAQAFTLDEMRELSGRAGLSFATLRHHYGHRFVLAGRKP